MFYANFFRVPSFDSMFSFASNTHIHSTFTVLALLSFARKHFIHSLVHVAKENRWMSESKRARNTRKHCLNYRKNFTMALICRNVISTLQIIKWSWFREIECFLFVTCSLIHRFDQSFVLKWNDKTWKCFRVSDLAHSLPSHDKRVEVKNVSQLFCCF